MSSTVPRLIETIKSQEKTIENLKMKIKRSESARKSTPRATEKSTRRASTNRTNSKYTQNLKAKDETINALTERLNRAFEKENEVILFLSKMKHKL